MTATVCTNITVGLNQSARAYKHVLFNDQFAVPRHSRLIAVAGGQAVKRFLISYVAFLSLHALLIGVAIAIASLN